MPIDIFPLYYTQKHIVYDSSIFLSGEKVLFHATSVAVLIKHQGGAILNAFPPSTIIA